MNNLVDSNKLGIYLRPILIGFVFILPAYFFYNLIEHHFYMDAPYLLDSGWYADIIWRNQLNVTNPGSILESGEDPSYFRVHFSPIFSLLSSLSYLTHFDRITWFAFYAGGAFGLLGVFVYLLVADSANPRTLTSKVLAVAVSAVVVWSGLSLRIASYPHTEILSVSLVVGWVWAVFSSRRVISWLLFISALIVREDTGFHIGGMVITYLVIVWLMDISSATRSFPKDLRRSLIRFGIVAILYSIFAFAIVRIFYPGSDAFVRIYSGNPPYSHLTSELLMTRLTQIFVDRLELTLPMVYFGVIAALTRSFIPLIGIFAFIPWLLVSALAQSDAAGTLSLYYGFPILIGQIFSLHCSSQVIGDRFRTLGLLLAIPAFLIPTFYCWKDFQPFLTRGFKMVSRDTVGEVRAFRNFIREQAASDPEMKVDIAVAALEPRVFKSALNQVHRVDSFKNKKLVVFNARGLQVRESDDNCVAIGAKYHYQWMHTNYILASAVPLDNAGAILLSKKPDPSIRPSVLIVDKSKRR